MPEYSSTTITPSDGVQVPGMNGSTSGNFLLSALKSYILSEKGLANGLASLDGNGKLLSSQLPDLADDVIVVASYASLPATGTAGKIYITADNNKMYRWDPDLETPNYVELSIDLSEYAKIVDIQDGNIQAGVAVKAFQDAMGRAIITTYETKADASDLKDAISAIDHRVENLEQPKGGYVVENYKDGAITPSGKGNWAVVEGLRGVSRVENQCIHDITSALSSSRGSVVSFADGVTTFTATEQRGGVYSSRTDNPLPQIDGHFILLYVDVKTTTATDQIYLYAYGGYVYKIGIPTTNWQQIAVVAQVQASWGYDFTYQNFFAIEDRRTADWDAVSVKNPKCIDLSVYFGTSDLSFLGATNAEKLATIQTNYPHLLLPSEYGTRIVDSSYTGVRAYSINIWDEEWTLGYWDWQNNGQFVANNNFFASKNKFPVSPSTTYYWLTPSVIREVLYYDASGNYVGRQSYSAVPSTTFTTPSNCYFIAFYYSSTYGNTYANNIQFCLDSDADKAIYHPHILDTLSLSFNGKSAGSVYDSCEPNVEVNGVAKKRETQRIDSVDLGTRDWTKSDNGNYFYAGLPTSSVTNSLALCAKYINVSSGQAMYLGTEDKVVGVALNYISGRTDRVYIRDSAYSDAITFKASLSGVMLNYQKATPVVTLSDPVLDNTLLTESGGRMATVQTGTVVDGSFDMGFINL